LIAFCSDSEYSVRSVNPARCMTHVYWSKSAEKTAVYAHQSKAKANISVWLNLWSVSPVIFDMVSLSTINPAHSANQACGTGQ